MEQNVFGIGTAYRSERLFNFIDLYDPIVPRFRFGCPCDAMWPMRCDAPPGSHSQLNNNRIHARAALCSRQKGMPSASASLPTDGSQETDLQLRVITTDAMAM